MPFDKIEKYKPPLVVNLPWLQAGRNDDRKTK